MNTLPLTMSLIAGSILFAAGAAVAAPPGQGNVVELWARGTTPQSADESPRGRTQTVDLDALPLVTATRFDAQYAQSRSYRGIPLELVLDRFQPERSLDLAILHFANGMAVPLPFRDAAAMKRLSPFVARGVALRRDEPMTTGQFPPLPKRYVRADARPISFAGNKLVVAGWWHPDLGDKVKPVFSPWSHVDTLVSVEFVESLPYYRQFDVDPDPRVQEGLALFRQACQFCHGARKVGARFGWDFVEPMPVYTYRKEMNLLYHVAYRPLDAAERGLMMPALRFMSRDQAAALWQWLRAVGTKEMPKYQPQGSAAVGPRAP
jgi:mono/diheme cytochrome c family protein